MNNFTKGPWEVKDGHCGRLTEPTEDYYFIDAGLGFLTKDTKEGFGICGFMNSSDAHLISAAPDMYEALKKALRESNNQSTVVLIKKALAKAEGKE